MPKAAVKFRAVVGLILALSIPAAPPAADAQQPRKAPRIGFLVPPSPSAAQHGVDAFRQGLRELGYVEGQNLAVEYRFGEGKLERLPELAAELVRLRVEVIVAVSTQGALAAKSATATIPIVMVNVGDPVGTGLAQSLARPGGNITGLSLMTPDLTGKQLELLKEVLPKLSRVAVLGDPANPVHAIHLQEAQTAGRALRVQPHLLEVRGPNEFEGAFGAATKGRADSLLVLAGPLMFAHRTRIVALAAKHQLPAMYPYRELVDVGGLMSYGASISA